MADPVSWPSVVEKIALVLLGWFLGWGAELIREYRNLRKLKKALLEELKDLQVRLREAEIGYAGELQLYSNGIVNTAVATDIQHPIYTHNYKDVCSKLNRDQRRSYEYIHAQIDAFNELIDREQEMITEYYAKPSNTRLENWGRIITSQFENVATIRWHINRHLVEPNRPSLDIEGPVHESYLQSKKAIRLKAAEIIEKAKTLDIREGLEARGFKIEEFSDPDDSDEE
jgi:hypothetical protein